MESVREAPWFNESRFSGEASLEELSEVAGTSRYRFALVATIRAWWKRIFELIRETLVVERRRQFNDVEQRYNTRGLGNFIEVYSPIFRWLHRQD
jgi:hypothetical protein